MERCWFLSQFLDERLALLSRAPRPVSELAQKRFTRWKQSSGLGAEEQLGSFLRSFQASEADLLAVLGEEEGHEAPDPSWVEGFRSAFAQAGADPAPLHPLAWPLLAGPRARLRALCSALAEEQPGTLEVESVLRAFEESLAQEMRRLSERVLVLEVNIARVEGRLEGGTPQLRHAHFLRLLRDPLSCEQIFREYPLLARETVHALELWEEAAAEFLRRYFQDLPALREKLGEGLTLLRAKGGQGDAHRNGRSVFVAEFSSGQKAVYKPRSLRVDGAFQELLHWLNEEGLQPPLRSYWTLERGDYGWEEFVAFAECADEEALRRFYLRQGSWIAILYALGATDMHLENQIAAGEHPMIIDLETLFHPRFRSRRERDAEDEAGERTYDSVLSIGLLPSPQRTGGRTIDKSGLGARAHEGAFEYDGLTDTGTDEVRVGKVEGKMGNVFSHPSLNGRRPDPNLYREAVQEGFQSTYRFLERRKGLLLAGDGPLQLFEGAPVRVVLRASATYASLLSESRHPKLLRNGLWRELLFAQLWEEAAAEPKFAEVIPSERRQLLNGDIPYFLSCPGSLDLEGGDGGVFPGVLQQSGLDAARSRIARLGDEDLAWQAWLVDASFCSSDAIGTFRRRRAPRVAAEGFLGAARLVAEQLAQAAVVHRGTASWPCLVWDSGGELNPDGSYRVGVIDDGIYRGLAGVIFFLAYYTDATGDPAIDALAKASFAQLEGRRDRWQNLPVLGPYTGLAGQVYLRTHLASLWKRPELLQDCLSLLPQLSELLAKDTQYDLIGGAAGCIPVFLSLHQASGGGGAREFALACGNHLLEAAHLTKEGGLSWPSLAMPRGFSHGGSGIGWALSKLFGATGEEKFRRAALAALKHERQLLAGGRWTDKPEGSTECAWCHGSPGIALARQSFLREIADEEVRADLQKALDHARRDPSCAAGILCHGDLGNLDTFHAAAELGEDWVQERNRRAQAILGDFSRGGWATPLPAHLAEPGLMMGLAGVGYGFLRAANPGRVPSVLTLEGPRV